MISWKPKTKGFALTIYRLSQEITFAISIGWNPFQIQLKLGILEIQVWWLDEKPPENLPLLSDYSITGGFGSNNWKV